MVAGLWLSYLFLLFYLAIAAGAVTHIDLLLGNPVKLPFLIVELPLLAFFALAPILFVITHAHALVHFVMLSGKVGSFRDEIDRQPANRAALQRLLPNNIFVQFLAGPDDIRNGGLGPILKVIAWITLVSGPILLLLLLQVRFLMADRVAKVFLASKRVRLIRRRWPLRRVRPPLWRVQDPPCRAGARTRQ